MTQTSLIGCRYDPTCEVVQQQVKNVCVTRLWDVAMLQNVSYVTQNPNPLNT